MPLILDSNLALGIGTSNQLSLYNGALLLLKERKLASLTENRESRRVLDDVWPGAVNYCLEQGLWNFAARTSKITYNAGYDAAFGYQNQFEKPDDMIRLVSLCSDEYQNVPLNRYVDEASCWYADVTEIYVTYTSNDAAYGFDYTRWPETFVTFVQAYLASQVGPRITSADNPDLEKQLRIALKDARSKDAMGQPTKYLPTGEWVASRGRNNQGPRGYRGSSNG